MLELIVLAAAAPLVIAATRTEGGLIQRSHPIDRIDVGSRCPVDRGPRGLVPPSPFLDITASRGCAFLSPSPSCRRSPSTPSPRTEEASPSRRRPLVAATTPRASIDAIARRRRSIDALLAGERSAEAEAASDEGGAARAPSRPLLVVIGGSGFLGSEIRRQLRDRGVRYLATSTAGGAAGDDEFVPLDLTAADAEEEVRRLIREAIGEGSDGDAGVGGEVNVISAMGAIGTERDESVNAALSRAVEGASRAGVERFVMIGNAKRVRRLARKVPFLKGYASGKDEAESTLRTCFGNRGCIVKPSFIYGGDEISLNPPRIPSSLGGLASEVLGLYPIRALADELPDALALPLAPPVSVETVAAAAINVALGIVEGYSEELEGDAIEMAGSVRGWREKERYEKWLRDELEREGVVYEGSSKEACNLEAVMEINEERRWDRIRDLKEQLLRGGAGDDVGVMEELECLRPPSMKPAYDPKLNGRWNFVLSKDDLGTQLVKELLPPEYYSLGNAEPKEGGGSGEASPPWKVLLENLYRLRGLFMRISDEQSRVDIVLSSSVLFGKVPIDIVFSTSLLSTNYDEATDGTLFLEKFESVEVGGVSLPLPSSWQRFRYLEITFLDDEILIARGSGGEPHVLVKASE